MGNNRFCFCRIHFPILGHVVLSYMALIIQNCSNLTRSSKIRFIHFSNFEIIFSLNQNVDKILCKVKSLIYLMYKIFIFIYTILTKLCLVYTNLNLYNFRRFMYVIRIDRKLNNLLYFAIKN